MVHVDPVVAAASHASVPVAFACLCPTLLPLADIGSGFPASPMVATFASVCLRDRNTSALQTASHALARLSDCELRAANLTCPLFLVARAPAGLQIALGRAISSATIFQPRSGTVEIDAASFALPRLAIPMPVERRPRDALVPWRGSNDGCLATDWRAVDAMAVDSWDWRAAAFARMWFLPHRFSISQYADMAERRIAENQPGLPGLA